MFCLFIESTKLLAPSFKIHFSLFNFSDLLIRYSQLCQNVFRNKTGLFLRGHPKYVLVTLYDLHYLILLADPFKPDLNQMFTRPGVLNCKINTFDQLENGINLLSPVT